MGESEDGRVQHGTARGGVGGGLAVRRIAENGVADRGQMRADLMHAAGAGPGLDQGGIVTQTFHDTELRHGGAEPEGPSGYAASVARVSA